MEDNSNFMVPTASRAYHYIESITGVGFKPMNVLGHPSVWSTTVLIKKGHSLPLRENTSLCEFLVISGQGKYTSGQAFGEGDYFRETKGEYEQIEAIEDVVLFLTNHGSTSFFDGERNVIWNANSNVISELLKMA